MIRFDILTLFPAIFEGFLRESLLAKAIQRGLVEIRRHDFRRFTTDKHQSVDDRPFGGGPGMVIKAPPVVECVEAVRAEPAGGLESSTDSGGDSGHLILFTPQGRRLEQRRVEELARLPRLLLLCGRYEGFDQRVIDLLQPEELSIGDYVLNGGEVAAMVLIEAVIRLLPGVLGDEQSPIDDSFSSGNRGLEFPQYTRPREYRGHGVPEVLLSGDHQAIDRWRRDQSRARTAERRADLLRPGQPTPGDAARNDTIPGEPTTAPPPEPPQTHQDAES